jgi:hypothetical protein
MADNTILSYNQAGFQKSVPALDNNSDASKFIYKTFSLALHENPAILSKFIGETLRFPQHHGKEIIEEFYLPVASNKNISTAGIGNNWNEEEGKFDNGETDMFGLQSGKPLRHKYFKYYYGGKEWTVYSDKQLDKNTTQFVNSEVENQEDNSPPAQYDLSDSEDIKKLRENVFNQENSGFYNGRGKPTQYKDGYGFVGLRAVVLPEEYIREDLATDDDNQKEYEVTVFKDIVINRKYIVKINNTEFSYTTKSGDTAKTVADNLYDQIVQPINNSTEENSIIFDDGDGVNAPSNTNSTGNYTFKLVPKKDTERLDDYTVTVNNLNLLKATVTQEWKEDSDATIKQHIVINFYTINPTNRISEVIIDRRTGLPLEAVYPIDTSDGSDHSTYESAKANAIAILERYFVDVFLTDAVNWAIEHGLNPDPANIDDEFALPIALAFKAQDTIRVIDVRRNYSDNPNDYYPDNYIDGLGNYKSKLAGKGRKYFAYNLADLVAKDYTEQIFCVFADSPISNMGGESMDFDKIINYLPIIGENTGTANTVGFSRFTKNATIYKMGMMFKFTKDLLLFSDYGVQTNNNKTAYNIAPLTAMTDAFAKEVQRQRDLALQIELINGAGLSFYPEGSMSIGSINRPLKALDLLRAYKTLELNGAYYDNDMVRADNTYGSAGIAKSYTMICPPEVVHTLRMITSGISGDETLTFQSSTRYAQGTNSVVGQLGITNPFVYEVGTIAGFRVIQAPPNWLIMYQGKGGIPPANLWISRSMDTYYFEDEPTPQEIRDLQLMGRMNQLFQTTGGKLDIYVSFVVSKGSAKTISLEGGNSTIKTVMPEASLIDPYENHGVVSTSWYFGVLISHSNRIMKIHSPVLR